MKNLNRIFHLAIAAFILTALTSVGSMTAQAAGHVSFKEDIFPVLQIRCLGCHIPGGEGYEKSGLDLRTYEGLMKGTKFGPIVVPGDAFTSNLNVLVEGRAAKAIRMPHNKKKLTRCELDLLRRWVNQGAKNN